MTLNFFLSFAFFFSFFFFMNVKISFACMTILVGKKASSTGEILVGHNEDAPGRFTMQTHLVKKQRRHPGTKIKFEHELSDLSLSTTRTNLFWSEAKTFSNDDSDSAFCDFYVNGHGVIICSNNCADSKEDNPELLNGGIGYGLRRLVAESATSAKGALDLACKLVDKFGYASSGRSYAFADNEEIYVIQIVHGKHYAIQRVPDDEVAVIPNHYTIHEPDTKAHGYDELVNYAVKRGWYKPKDGAFDFQRAYQSESSFGLEKNTHRHVRAFEILLEMDLSGLLNQKWETLPFSIKPAHKVSIETLKKILRTHFEGTSSYVHDKDNPNLSEPLTTCNCEGSSSYMNDKGNLNSSEPLTTCNSESSSSYKDNPNLSEPLTTCNSEGSSSYVHDKDNPNLSEPLTTCNSESSSSYKGNPHFSKPLTICNCDTLESTIAQIRHNPYRIILRRALGRPCFSPYVVWYSGINKIPEGYEEINSEAAIMNHFSTRPSDMDYRSNAWYRAMEVQAACDILYHEKGEYVRSKIAEFESREEEKLSTLDSQIELCLHNEPKIARAMMDGAVLSWTNEAEACMNDIKRELGVITAEALDYVRSEESFRVRVPNHDFRITECICGPSYKNQSYWSKCRSIKANEGYTEIEFDSGSWFDDAVPCFTDLYMKMTDDNGNVHAGIVRVQVQKF